MSGKRVPSTVTRFGEIRVGMLPLRDVITSSRYDQVQPVGLASNRI